MYPFPYCLPSFLPSFFPSFFYLFSFLASFLFSFLSFLLLSILPFLASFFSSFFSYLPNFSFSLPYLLFNFYFNCFCAFLLSFFSLTLFLSRISLADESKLSHDFGTRTINHNTPGGELLLRERMRRSEERLKEMRTEVYIGDLWTAIFWM